MSLLTLIQDAARTLKQNAPSVVTTSTDELVAQMKELANKVGDELSRRAEWQELRREVTFYAQATLDQGYLVSIASDFDRMVDDTFWNRGQVRKVDGPVTAEEWQQDRANNYSGPGLKYTTRGGRLLVSPAFSSGEVCAFEYFSKQWCETTGGTGQTAFTYDSDIVRLPERIFKLGLIFEFLKTNDFPYAEAQEDYENAIEVHSGNVSGSRVLFLGGSQGISNVNIQDNNFG